MFVFQVFTPSVNAQAVTDAETPTANSTAVSVYMFY